VLAHGEEVVISRRPNRISLDLIERVVPKCTRCPELRSYCKRVAQEKRKAFSDWTYWGRPVPSFGDHDAKILIVGLAPAAHGANRTGRMFTGDRSGDFLYAALHRAGLANQPTSMHREDRLKLRGVYITAALRCAPPANKPAPRQLANCAQYLYDEMEVFKPRVIICLGAIAWNAVMNALANRGANVPKPRPRFAHGSEIPMGDAVVMGCYHVSQQNTFTGRLTPSMLDVILNRAKKQAALTAAHL
jgi:uracil-DNA glycosylase